MSAVNFYNIFEEQNKVIAGFTNRWGGISKKPFDNLNLSFLVGDEKENVLVNRQRLKDFLDDGLIKTGTIRQEMAWMQQVHSDSIQIVDRPGEYSETDGLITNKQGLKLMVLVADCIPVLFYDQKQKVIAVAHAGRRGGFKNISGKIIEKMKKEFYCRPEDILVTLGRLFKKLVIGLIKILLKNLKKSGEINLWKKIII